MAYLAVNKDGTEIISHCEPERHGYVWSNILQVGDPDGVWDGCESFEMDLTIKIPKGSIKRLIGRNITWKDDPVDLENKNRYEYISLKWEASLYFRFACDLHPKKGDIFLSRETTIHDPSKFQPYFIAGKSYECPEDGYIEDEYGDWYYCESGHGFLSDNVFSKIN